MRYLLIGDTHGDKHLDKLKRTLAALSLGRRDVLIHCGDFGAPWAQDDDAALRWWRGLPWRTVVCLGNHENYGFILRQPIVRRFGCRGYDLGGRVFVPLPGEIARIGGRSFWFYPGGLSIDFPFRRPDHNLFLDELLTPQASRAALERLYSRGPVDYVISHDGPRSFVLEQFGFPLKLPPDIYYRHLGAEPGSRVHPAFALDEVYARPELYGRWYFGHHHRDIQVGKLRCLWQQMVLEDSRSQARQIIDTSEEAGL